MDKRTHAYGHSWREAIIRSQELPTFWLARTWFKKSVTKKSVAKKSVAVAIELLENEITQLSTCHSG